MKVRDIIAEVIAFTKVVFRSSSITIADLTPWKRNRQALTLGAEWKY